jgi:DNA-binding protein HU-beta
MNKTELVKFVANECEITQVDASRALNAVLKGITESAKNGHGLQIPGFGSFDVRERSARKGRNPQTGEEIQIAASKSLGFKNGKALKDLLNT